MRETLYRSLGGRKLPRRVPRGVGAAMPRPRRAHDGLEVRELRVPAELALAQRGVGYELSWISFPPQPHGGP